MSRGVRRMIRRTAPAAVLAAPLGLASPSAPAFADPVPIGGGVYIDIQPGQVVTPRGLPVSVGTVVDQLGSTAAGYCDVEPGSPVGVIVAAGATGMAVNLDISTDCRVVVSSIANNISDLDPAEVVENRSPGTGVPPAPAALDDAAIDSAYLTNSGGYNALSIYTCKHEAWAKATMLDETNTTATESRAQVRWSSTGHNECYGRSVSNMIVDTNAKKSYCYSAWWEMSSHEGCWYTVDRSAPSNTSARVWGEMRQQGAPYNLHAYNWAGLSTETPWVYKCFVTDGQIRSGSKLNCKGRQLS